MPTATAAPRTPAFSYTEGQVAVADALGDTTTYSFDNRGLLVQVQNPLQSTVSFAYDTNLNSGADHRRRGPGLHQHVRCPGQLLSSTDPLGDTVKYTYSATDDRLASVTDAKGNITRYAYLCLCQLAVADFWLFRITRSAKLTQPLRSAVVSRSFCYRRSQGTSRCSFAHKSMAA